MAVQRNRKADAPFGLVLRQLFQGVRASFEDSLKPTGFTAPQSMVLMTIGREPGMSGAELARRAMITPQAMGELLAGLEKAGLLRRLPHPDNGRMQATHLTEAGQAALVQCRAAMGVVETRMLAPMSAADRKTFSRLLACAVEGLKQSG